MLYANCEIKFYKYILLVLLSVYLMGECFHIKECSRPLGMESGEIPESWLYATSSYVQTTGPNSGRLRINKHGGAWCPRPAIDKDSREYLQINLDKVHLITEILTQGRFDHGRGQEYVEEYKLEYYRPSLKIWKPYKLFDEKQVFKGNRDTASIVSQKLTPPIIGSGLRIIPFSLHRRTVCLRAEIKGCVLEGDISSYNLTQDEWWNESPDLSDLPYDGDKIDGKYVDGLGRLVDGISGGNNFKMDINNALGTGWIAWNNETMLQKYENVEIVFRFNNVRNFSMVHIYTSNQMSKGAQIFSNATITFSIGGQLYNGPYVLYTHNADLIGQSARNVSIELNHNVGKFVKIELYFSNQIIAISEVFFESEPVDPNTQLHDEETKSEEEAKVFRVSGGYVEPPWESSQSVETERNGGHMFLLVLGFLTALAFILFGIIFILMFGNRINGFWRNNSSVSSSSNNHNGVTYTMEGSNGQSPTVNLNLHNMFNHATANGGYDIRSHNMSNNVEIVGGNVYDLPNSPTNTLSCTMRNYRTFYNTNQSATHASGISSSASTSTGASLRSVRRSVDGESSRRATFLVPCDDMQGVDSRLTPLDEDNTRRGSSSTSARRHSRTTRRRHTASREKLQLPPPFVQWNIVPISGLPYKAHEGGVISIPMHCLKLLQNTGTSHIGDVFNMICVTDCEAVHLRKNSRVVVRTTEGDIIREVKMLLALRNPNLVRVLGVCTCVSPTWIISDHPAECGDAVFFLQNNRVSYLTMLYMAVQISSAMKYLESMNLVHKDLAARNCVMSRGQLVKVTDIAINDPKYRRHYARLGAIPAAPIRWMPWESIIGMEFFVGSGVWLFAVTLWEILTEARVIPYPHLTDEQVIQNAYNIQCNNHEQIAILPRPELCTDEVYELMCDCWHRKQERRPTFKQIHSFMVTQHADLPVDERQNRNSNDDYGSVV